MLRLTAILGACAVSAILVSAQQGSRSLGWQTYTGDAQGRRYSPLRQINTKNVSQLKLAWQYGVADAAAGSVNAAGRSQAVPIVVGGVLYTSTSRRTVVALDPASGKEIWKHELEKGAPPIAACRTGQATTDRRHESSPARLTDVCSRSMREREN